MIFSRDRGSGGRHVRPDDEGRGHRGRHTRGRRAEPREDDRDDNEVDLDDAPPAGASQGPYDVSEAPDDGLERFDLGALRIPAISGIEIRMQAGPEGEVQQVVLVHGDSALELGVFAAPRTEGIWDEVRAELRAALGREGARPEEIEGEYGVELRAKVRSADGPTQVRFVGVDGPRWFVRATYQGPAAVDPARAATLREVLCGLVVDRGTQAMPVREALPLRLPPAAAEQMKATGQAAVPDAVPESPAGVNGSAPSRGQRRPRTGRRP
ncbi:MAG: DUF3710 domain-containing protein [Micromonosporaceae bacterium]